MGAPPALAAGDAYEQLFHDQILSEYAVGRIDEGDAHLTEFEARFPGSPLLGDLYLEQARNRPRVFDTLAAYRTVIERFEAPAVNEAAHLGMIALLLGSGDAVSAVKEAEAFTRANPSGPARAQALEMLGRGAAGLGRHSAAANAYATILTLHADSPHAAKARLGLADARFQLGNYEEARRLYEEALKERSPDVDPTRAVFGLAQTLERLGKKNMAHRYYRRLAEEYPDSFYAAAARERAGPALGAAAPTFAPAFAPRERYAVRIVVASAAEAEAAVAQYQRAGLRTRKRPRPDGGAEVLVGAFSTRMQAEFFAEELVKGSERRYDVVELPPGDAEEP